MEKNTEVGLMSCLGWGPRTASGGFYPATLSLSSLLWQLRLLKGRLLQ